MSRTPFILGMRDRFFEALYRIARTDRDVVFVTAERLYQEQRSMIEAVFGCPVANGYGGRDAGFIAHACREGRLHVTAEDIIAYCRDHLAHYKAPRYVYFTEIPKTSTGKIQKFKLREKAGSL